MDLITLALVAFAVTYITHVLLLEQKVSHFGPFPSKDLIVFFKANEDGEGSHVQPVTLFDWVRRPFGVYKVEKHIWYVNEVQSERWTCPICLSFWIAAGVLLAQFLVPPEIFQQLMLLFALAGFSSIVNVNLL